MNGVRFVKEIIKPGERKSTGLFYSNDFFENIFKKN